MANEAEGDTSETRIAQLEFEVERLIGRIHAHEALLRLLVLERPSWDEQRLFGIAALDAPSRPTFDRPGARSPREWCLDFLDRLLRP